MPVVCKICKREFVKQITNSHLKSHQITTLEYKEMFGEDSLASDEYRKEKSERISGKNNPMYGKSHSDLTKNIISEKNKGMVAHNKGVQMSSEQKELLRIQAFERNERWHEDETHPLIGRKHSEYTKNLIREKRKDQIISSESYKKASETRKKLNIKPMLGKHHSDETITKIKESTKASREERKNLTHMSRLNKLENLNLEFIEYQGNFMHVKCKICGNTFFRSPQFLDDCRLRPDICSVCYPKISYISQQENELHEYIKSIIPDETIIRNNRSVIGMELDIYIPNLNIAFEYNGLYWHSELQGKDKNYHLNKMELCNAKNIKLIHIFEDEWCNKNEIVRSRIENILGKTPVNIGARKCKIVELSPTVANKFLNEHHIQGSGRSNIRLGLEYNNELVCVMTFSNSNPSRRIYGWELNRFSNKKHHNIIGGASKLFNFFVKKFDPSHVVSYADRRWSSGHLYENLNFDFTKYTVPNYWYIDVGERIHRYTLRKNENDNPLLSEWENRKLQGWNRIWDCGNIRFDWTK